MTVLTWVCWSITSLTQIAYGSLVSRQGSSRRVRSYQRSSGIERSTCRRGVAPCGAMDQRAEMRLSMSKPVSVPLEAIRTDGWFERIGEGIGSFQALCDIVGARFFAFAMITGARITSLTVDRRVPENTLVEFVVGSDEEE